MSSILKRISGITLLVVGLMVSFVSVKAQSSANSYFNLQPQIYVKDVTLDKTTYSPGDIVSGTFVAANVRKEDATNLTYKVFLVGGYNKDGGLYNYEWDNQQFGPISLSSSEKRKISFSYKLPVSSEGYSKGDQLGIKVRFYSNNGSPLGWSDTFVTVSGSSLTAMAMTDSRVVVNEKSYGLQDGPMIYAGNNAYFELTLSNPSNTDVELIPSTSIYSMQSVQNIISASTSAPVILKARSSNNIVKVDLSSFSNKPGVYMGETVLKDSDGNDRTPVVRFRFLINGDIVNISSVISDKSSFNAGDTLNFKVIYTGNPFDIAKPTASSTLDTKSVDFIVKVYNESGDLVCQYTENGIDVVGATVKNFSVKCDGSAKASYAEVFFNKGDKQIGYLKTILSSDFDSVVSQLQKELVTKIVAGFSVVLLLIIVLIIIGMKTKKKKVLGKIIASVFVGLLFFGSAKAATTVPGVPTIGIPTVLNTGNDIRVPFTASSSDGGAPVDFFEVTTATAPSGGTKTTTGTVSPITLTNFVKAGNYTFKIRAHNSKGYSGYSTASSPATNLNISVPGAPTNVSAVAGNGQAAVSFTPPASLGGIAINYYTVTSAGTSSSDVSATGTGNTIVVPGLYNSYLTHPASYKFTVTATNDVGTSVASSPSNSVSPQYVYDNSGFVIVGAGPYSNNSWTNAEVPNVYLSSPYPASVGSYKPGDTVNIQGSYYYAACSNGSGMSGKIYIKPISLASGEPNILSGAPALATLDSYNYVISTIKNKIGGAGTFSLKYSSKTTGKITCNGHPTSGDQVCESIDFSSSFVISTSTTPGIYRLYIYADNPADVGTVTVGGDRAATQVLGYQDISVGTPPAPPVCGNNIIENGEVCDGTSLGGASCTTLGFTGGTLHCALNCSSYDTSSCTGSGGCSGSSCGSGGGPTCTDGIQNGNETGIDCGGSCPNSCSNPNGFQNMNQPTITATNSGNNCGPISATASWNAWSGASSYNVRYIKQGDLFYNVIPKVTSTSATISTPTPNTTYTFDIQALGATGTPITNYSTPGVSFTTSPACQQQGQTGTYNCSAYYDNGTGPVLWPAEVLVNKQMKWKLSGLPSGYDVNQLNWVINGVKHVGITEFPMLYTTVGTKTISGSIFGTTTSGTTFSGTCSATTTVIQGNGGFQEI